MCVLDGMFEAAVREDSEHGTRTTASSVMLHPATGIASEVLSSNSPLRAAAVALAEALVAGPVQAGAAQAESNSAPANGEAMGAAAGVPTTPGPIEPVQPKPAAHCL